MENYVDHFVSTIFHVFVLGVDNGIFNRSVCNKVDLRLFEVRLFEVFVGLFDLRIRDLVAPVAKHFEYGLAHSVEYTLFSHLTQHLFLLLIENYK